MLKGNPVGIYFSQDSIDVVESSGRRCFKYYSLAIAAKQEARISGLVEEDRQRMVGNLNKSLREALIESRNVILTVAAENLVIRFFQMPPIPARELESAINFEARKYVPFSMQELISDYQTVNKKGQLGILFVAVKKSVLDFLLSVLQEAKLNLIAIEAAPFSLLRALKLAGQVDKSNLVIVNFNARENGDITILDSGFPVFSRDIKLIPGLPIGPEKGMDSVSSRLISEIRLSLEYYFRRQPYQKLIDKLVFISEGQLISKLKDSLSKELDLRTTTFSPADLLGKNEDVNLGLVTAFGASLRGNINTAVSLDLMKKVLKADRPKGEVMPRTAKRTLAIPILQSPVLKTLVICSLVISFVYLNGSKRIIMEKQALEKIKSQRKGVGFYTGLNLVDLKSMQDKFKTKTAALEKLVDNRIYLTNKLNVLANILPQGCWLTEISFQRQQDSMQFKLKGRSFLDSETEELAAINRLMANLKNETDFSQGFKDISLQYISRNKLSEWQVTDFEISCN